MLLVPEVFFPNLQLMNRALPIYLLLFALVFASCKNEDSYSLVHQIVNESSRTLTFRFTNTPDLLDTVFVIPPSVTDTVISYTDTGPIIAAPNCGLGTASAVTVQGGGTLLKEPGDASNWESVIDQDAGRSSCTFIVRDEDIY